MHPGIVPRGELTWTKPFRYTEAIEKVPIEVALMALRQVRQRLRACHDSTSWRITAPLRAVSNAARRMAASWRRSSA